LGKLFTAILNARLNDYTEEFMIPKENQSGIGLKIPLNQI
jgi:hypothetical protein